MKIIGLLIIAVPFAFAGIRFLSTGSDMRYLWMAGVSTLFAVIFLFEPNRSKGPSKLRVGITAVVVAVCVAATAVLLGATAVSGVALVAVSFGFCSTLGTGIILLSRSDKNN